MNNNCPSPDMKSALENWTKEDFFCNYTRYTHTVSISDNLKLEPSFGDKTRSSHKKMSGLRQIWRMSQCLRQVYHGQQGNKSEHESRIWWQISTKLLIFHHNKLMFSSLTKSVNLYVRFFPPEILVTQKNLTSHDSTQKKNPFFACSLSLWSVAERGERRVYGPD